MNSKFDGGLLGLIGIGILQCIIIVCTLGLGIPFAVCVKENWYAKHTKIDGMQVTFDGNGFQLFGTFIKWFLLTVITLGIYSFWVTLKMKAWVVSHTHLEGRPAAAAPAYVAPAASYSAPAASSSDARFESEGDDKKSGMDDLY